jgi:hypothetical protein
VKRGGPLRRRTPLRNRPSRNEVPPEVRAGVIRRAGGRCERYGCLGRPFELHHRKSRRYRDHRPSNLLWLCIYCHAEVTDNPVQTIQGRPAGWVLRGHQVPEAEPVWMVARGWVLLGDDYEVNEWRAA